MNEENNDFDRAFRWLFLTEDLRMDTILALEKAYAPTLPRFVADEVADELIRLREGVLGAPGGDVAQVDRKAACEHVANWLAAGFLRHLTAFELAGDVLRICTIELWRNLERERGVTGYIAQLSREQRRGLHMGPEVIYTDIFVEITGPLFRRVVSDFSRQIVEYLNVSEGPLERIDSYLGLRSDLATPEVSGLPVT
jgi:hypothetical protein